MSRVFEDVRRLGEKTRFHLCVGLGLRPKRPEFPQEKTNLDAFKRKVRGRDYWQLCRDVSGRAELLRLRALTWRERLTDHRLRVENAMEKLLPAKEKDQILQKYGHVRKVEPVEVGRRNREKFAWYKAEQEKCVEEIDHYFRLAKEKDQILKAMEDELERRRDSEPAEKL